MRQITIFSISSRLTSSSFDRTAQVEQEFARFRQTHPPTLTSAERDAILSLSKDLPSLWHAPTTTPSDRQRIFRLLLERVVVTVQGSSDHVDVALHWAGGFASQHELVRPVLRYEQMADYARLLERIDKLRKQGWSFAKIAEQLNREGFRPPKRVAAFHSDIVSRLVRKLEKKLPGERARAPRRLLGDNEWLAIDLAAQLAMSKNTLFSWIKRGWIRVVRKVPGYRGA